MRRRQQFGPPPPGRWPKVLLETPDEIDWLTEEEFIAEQRRKNWLAKMQSRLARYQREDDELRQRRAAEIAREIEAARERQQLEDRLARARQERDDREARVTNWWIQQQKDNKDLIALTEKYQAIVDDSPLRRKLREKQAQLDKLQKDIDRLAAREERKTLLARGVVKGRRKV